MPHPSSSSRSVVLSRPCACIAFALLAGCGAEDKAPSSAIVRVPQDFATIQAAINGAKSGSTIVVADGVYRGAGNRDLSFHGKPLTLRSESGPEHTVIDCDASQEDPHSGFVIGTADDPLIEGFTIRGGYTGSGAGIYCLGGSPTIRNCVFDANTAFDSGGALRCKGASPRLVRCTFVRNASAAGGGVFLIAGSSPVFEQCVIALSVQGGAVYIHDRTCQPRFECCDIFGNTGGDWNADIEPQADSSGNFNLDPLFCSVSQGDFHLRAGSPCLEAGSPCGKAVGALGAGCE